MMITSLDVVPFKLDLWCLAAGFIMPSEMTCNVGRDVDAFSISSE